MLIFHVAAGADWAAAHLDDGYRMSTRGRSLDDEGFIHCSRYLQLDEVLENFYRDFPGRLTLLTINPRRLRSPWRFDDVPGAPMTFPHVYGPINREAVVAATPIIRDEDGSFDYGWFLPGPLATSRLVLREGTDEDWPFYRRTLVEAAVRDHLGGPVPAAEADARRREVASKGCLVIERDRSVLGFVLLGFYRTGDFEISYLLLPEHQHRGYAREAVSTATEWAFAVFTHLPRLVAVTQQANVRSTRLLEELNWRPVDRFVEWGEPQVMYAMNNPSPM